MSRPTREQLAADVQAFLDAGGKPTTPPSRQLRARFNGKQLVWVGKVPDLSTTRAGNAAERERKAARLARSATRTEP